MQNVFVIMRNTIQGIHTVKIYNGCSRKSQKIMRHVSYETKSIKLEERLLT